MTLLGFNLPELLRKTGREIMEDDVPSLAAGVAYNFFLAIFPLLLFLAPLLSLIGDQEQTVTRLLDSLGGSLPPAAFELFRNVLNDVVFAKGAPGLMSVGALGALWAGSNAFAALGNALNTAFDAAESRSWWRRRLRAIAVTIGTGSILLVVSALVVGGERMAVAMFGDEAGRIVAILQIPAAAIILVAIAMLNFSLLPNVEVQWRFALAGAVLTVALWLIVTMLFRWYVQSFGNYNATYGTIGGVIVLLTWIWLSMIALLAGGELASEMQHGTAQLTTARTGSAPRASTDRIVRAKLS